MEYLIIVGFMLAITIPMIIISYDSSSDTRDTININQARKVAKKIVDNAEAVYYLGEPSRTTLDVYFPTNIDSILITNKEVNLRVIIKGGRFVDVSENTAINLTGSINESFGRKTILVESKGSYVNITQCSSSTTC